MLQVAALLCLAGSMPVWLPLSSLRGELPAPGWGNQQTAAVVADFDGDGRLDFVAAERTKAPSVLLYRQQANGWQRCLLEPAGLRPEAGGAALDVDGDGDLDLVLGGDAQSDQIWWWENPGAKLDPARGWTRRLVKSGGGRQHRDQVAADFDGDGRDELASWCQGSRQLLLLKPPADPHGAEPWRHTVLYTYPEGTAQAGLAVADIDLDGRPDLIGGGRWFKLAGDGPATAVVIDEAQSGSRVAAGQLVTSGSPEVVFCSAQGSGALCWYDSPDRGATWRRHELLNPIRDGQSVAVADFDGDDLLDVYAAERHTPGPGADCRLLLWLGDGEGLSGPEVLGRGICGHESRVADFTGDGLPDLLLKPYTAGAPRLDIWRQPARPRGADAGAVDATVGRCRRGLASLWDFAGAEPDFLRDRQGLVSAVEVPDTAAVEPTAGVLRVLDKVLLTAPPPTSLMTTLMGSQALSVELWVKPANLEQEGPARLFTISKDPNTRNLTVGQEKRALHVRLRTTSTGDNGANPEMVVPDVFSEQLVHVVYTWAKGGEAKVYVDGQPRAGLKIDGDLSNWDPAMRLALANEVTGDRVWRGDLHLVAVYAVALTPAEVAANYRAGQRALGERPK